MLSTLRQGTPVFVIFRNGPRVATAKVAQISSQYPPQFNIQMGQMGANMSPMFDLTLEMDGKTELFQRIPVNTSIAEFPEKGIIISESRDGVINEVTAIRGNAVSELDKRSYYEQTVANCDQILLDVNPDLKREQEQGGKIAKLEQQLAGMSDQIVALTGMLSKSLGKKKEE
jgi:hypothetical protein